MSDHRTPITRHAMIRFCERVRPDLDCRTVAGMSAAYEAMRQMMARAKLSQGVPTWWTGEGSMRAHLAVDDVSFVLWPNWASGRLTVVTTVVKGWVAPAPAPPPVGDGELEGVC